MKTVSSDQFGSRGPEGLLNFLRFVQESAIESGEPLIASISLRVRDLDPLAVLQSIHEPDEPHLYLERGNTAVSGAESVARLDCTGEERFEKIRRFISQWSDRFVATGDLDGWFSGPLFFQAFSFSETANPAATVFVPKWQVCRTESECVAVANLRVEAETDLKAEAERILRAHANFSEPSGFDPPHSDFPQTLQVRSEEGALFQERVQKALEIIQTNSISKVVLSRWMEIEAETNFQPLEILRRLREVFSDCFTFSYSRGEGSSWIGATPERLIRVAGRDFQTEALAGSTPRGRDSTEDSALASRLLASEKDLREHKHVVEAIRAGLEGMAEVIRVGHHPHLLRLSNIQHLRTPIEGVSKPEYSILDFAERLHPTPAVCGVPGEKADHLIGELEPFERRLFTGFLGWQKPSGEGELVVALRTARITGKKARLFAGAGIVEKSDPVGEWRETEAKLDAMAGAIFAKRSRKEVVSEAETKEDKGYSE